VRSLEDLQRDYRVAFLTHVASRNEASLHAGYRVGRRAVEDGFTLLDLSRIHHEVFRQALAETRPGDLGDLVDAASQLFLEVLSTWQMLIGSAQPSPRPGQVPGAG
jgi:hypothetical protein